MQLAPQYGVEAQCQRRSSEAGRGEFLLLHRQFAFDFSITKDISMKKYVTKQNIAALARIAILCALPLLVAGFSPAIAATLSRSVDVGVTLDRSRMPDLDRRILALDPSNQQVLFRELGRATTDGNGTRAEQPDHSRVITAGRKTK